MLIYQMHSGYFIQIRWLEFAEKDFFDFEILNEQGIEWKERFIEGYEACQQRIGHAIEKLKGAVCK